MAEDDLDEAARGLSARIRDGRVTITAARTAARLGDPLARRLFPDEVQAVDAEELASDIRGSRHACSEKAVCVRIAVAASGHVLGICNSIVPDLEKSAALAALHAARDWCIAPDRELALRARDASRTCFLLTKGMSGLDLTPYVVGAAQATAEAASADPASAWRRSAAAALSEAEAGLEKQAVARLLERRGDNPTEEARAEVRKWMDSELISAVLGELVPWLFGDADPLREVRAPARP